MKIEEIDLLRCPEAEGWLFSHLDEYKRKNSVISRLEQELSEKTNTRLFDWIDHFNIPVSTNIEKELKNIGFEQEFAMPTYRVFTHHVAKLPSVLLLDPSSKHFPGLSIKVDQIADYLMVRGLQRCIEGSFFSSLRRSFISKENGIAFYVVERRGTRTMEPVYSSESELDNYLTALERWQTRPRFDLEEEAFNQAIILAEEMVSTVGKDMAATIVIDCERRYWQSKNTAAKMQKSRQDRFGMGWSNVYAHTFRSSRSFFSKLVRLFEMLGFHCVQKVYENEGFGIQVMKNATAGLILFLEVDLLPGEELIDFAIEPLTDTNLLNKIGLWSGLHGESILQGGMHHLEAKFQFDQLKHEEFLHKALTRGENWQPAHERIENLLKKGSITHEEADLFLRNGALGSFLSNLSPVEQD